MISMISHIAFGAVISVVFGWWVFLGVHANEGDRCASGTGTGTGVTVEIENIRKEITKVPFSK
jgi:hypothetical protein